MSPLRTAFPAAQMEIADRCMVAMGETYNTHSPKHKMKLPKHSDQVAKLAQQGEYQ